MSLPQEDALIIYFIPDATLTASRRLCSVTNASHLNDQPNGDLYKASYPAVDHLQHFPDCEEFTA